MYFPVSLFQFILPLFFVVFEVFDLRLVRMVSVDLVAIGAALVVNYGPTFHILVVIVHVHISLWVSCSWDILAGVHLAGDIKVFNILTGANSVLQSFINALSLAETQTLELIVIIPEVSKPVSLWRISKALCLTAEQGLAPIILAKMSCVLAKWSLIHF